jgi:hypothetical protein
MVSGDYRAALAHVETAAALSRPNEHRDSAFRYGQGIRVQTLKSAPPAFSLLQNSKFKIQKLKSNAQPS